MSSGLAIFNSLMRPDFQQVLGLNTSQTRKLAMSSVNLIFLSLSLSLRSQLQCTQSRASLTTQKMRENKSRCLPSEEGSASFPAGVSAIANGNALHRLLLRVICSGQPLPPHTQRYVSRNGLGLDTNYAGVRSTCRLYLGRFFMVARLGQLTR